MTSAGTGIGRGPEKGPTTSMTRDPTTTVKRAGGEGVEIGEIAGIEKESHRGGEEIEAAVEMRTENGIHTLVSLGYEDLWSP